MPQRERSMPPEKSGATTVSITVPAIQRCFGTTEPFDDKFCSMAVELLAPMIEAAGEKAASV